MAEIDGEVNLVVLRDVKHVLLVLHVHSDELVADLRGMLCVVHQAEELGLDVQLHFWITVNLDAFALDFLGPAVLVEALSEENNVGKDDFVILNVDAVAHSVEVKRENLVAKHLLPVIVGEIVVVPGPLLRIGVRWQH